MKLIIYQGVTIYTQTYVYIYIYTHIYIEIYTHVYMHIYVTAILQVFVSENGLQDIGAEQMYSQSPGTASEQGMWRQSRLEWYEACKAHIKGSLWRTYGRGPHNLGTRGASLAGPFMGPPLDPLNES